MKVISIVGARPNFIKIAPLMREMKKSKVINPLLLHTGQHYDVLMSENFFRELKIPNPDISLEVGSATHAKQVAKIMERFDDVCVTECPDAILVVGDVNSTMACTLVAAKRGIKTVHVEAGIRSFDRTMPEEINRMVTDSVCDLLLPPSEDAVENLLKEGHSKESIHLVGNIMIDTLNFSQPKIRQSDILDKMDLKKDEFTTVTLHRPSNVDHPENFMKILKAFLEIEKRVKIVFPVHPRTRKMLQEKGLNEMISKMKNLILCDPLGYFDFGRLISDSKMVITDSGGIQEETTVYGIPCITLRENTERPITITEGTNELAGTDTEKIIEFSNMIMDGKWKTGRIPKLWDGNTAKRITECLENNL